MNKKRFFLLILVLLIITSGFVLHIRFSAYASCRALAMNTKGFSAWKYESTIEEGSQAQVSFLDIYNNPLTCNATRIGPFWFATSYSRILANCSASLTNHFDPCPEDYFGVEP